MQYYWNIIIIIIIKKQSPLKVPSSHRPQSSTATSCLIGGVVFDASVPIDPTSDNSSLSSSITVCLQGARLKALNIFEHGSLPMERKTNPISFIQHFGMSEFLGDGEGGNQRLLYYGCFCDMNSNSSGGLPGLYIRGNTCFLAPLSSDL